MLVAAVTFYRCFSSTGVDLLHSFLSLVLCFCFVLFLCFSAAKNSNSLE